jgi:hypothetical protein
LSFSRLSLPSLWPLSLASLLPLLHPLHPLHPSHPSHSLHPLPPSYTLPTLSHHGITLISCLSLTLIARFAYLTLCHVTGCCRVLVWSSPQSSSTAMLTPSSQSLQATVVGYPIKPYNYGHVNPNITRLTSNRCRVHALSCPPCLPSLSFLASFASPIFVSAVCSAVCCLLWQCLG